jgi:hypothetical protein
VSTYYVVKTGPDRFDLRQTRFAEQLKAGSEHPWDVMATHFTAEDMREIIAEIFPDTDASVLPPEGIA